MKKRIFIPIVLVLLVVLGLLLFKVFNHNYIDELKLEYNTVFSTPNYDLSLLDEKLTNKEELENTVESYIKDLYPLYEEVNNYNTNIDINDLDNYNHLEKLNELSDKLNNINISNYLGNSEEEEVNKIIDSNILDGTKDKLNIKKEEIESNISIVNYLKENKDNYSVEDNTLIFTTRAKYNEFKEYNTSINYDLIKDTEGPVINAKDTSITVNNNYDIMKSITCVDKVDGNVECTKEGSYDTSKVGTYKITIKAKDLSNNESSKTITVSVVEKKKVVNTKPYLIEVIRNQNVVLVYGLDDNNEYTKLVKTFICSVGRNNWTPTGTFSTTKGYDWGALFGGVWGQYSTRITGHILFHSVPYFSKNKADLEWEEYNKLGTAASAGCVRMTVQDVKWIFDNCPVGTTVKIYDGNLPAGVTKPTTQKIDGSNPNRGWDPTDPDPANPWKK